MLAPRPDPKAEKDLLPILKRNERLLWAARRRRPGRLTRYATYVWFALYFAMTTAFVISGGAAAAILIGVMFLPSVYLRFLSMWFVTYGITDKRFYIVCRLWPRSWETFNLVDWETNWLRFGAGRNKIHLVHYGRRERLGWWNKIQYSRYDGHIENIPDLEAVRELLLKQIGSSERPDEEARIKKKPRKPVVSGTMTG